MGKPLLRLRRQSYFEISAVFYTCQQRKNQLASSVLCCSPPPGLQSGDGTEQRRSVAALAGLQAALLHPALIHQCLFCFVRILMSVFTQNKTFSKCGYVNVHSTCTNTIHFVCGLSDFQLKKEEKTH